MGLYGQPNDWTCGPFALKHALVTLGRLSSENEISSVAHPHWWAGTDEVKLARAARAFDCELPFVRRKDEVQAFELLTKYMTLSIPVILCVDDWGHWITVVRHEQGRFVVIDSKSEPVLNVLTWPQLRKRWIYSYINEHGDEKTYFDLHPVRPNFRVNVKAKFSVQRARYLRRPENSDLAQHWDDYLGDLLEVCRPRSSRRYSALSMGEFLRRHQDLLISRLSYWHGSVKQEKIARILRNFRFVAETYALVIPVSASRQALVDLSMLLAMWASASKGIGNMYGAGGNHN